MSNKKEPVELTKENLAAFDARQLKAVRAMNALAEIMGLNEIRIGSEAITQVVAGLCEEFGLQPDNDLAPHCDCAKCQAERS